MCPCACARSWDEAILSFDCQRLLGLELDDHAELAHSFVGMAEGYYEVGTWVYICAFVRCVEQYHVWHIVVCVACGLWLY